MHLADAFIQSDLQCIQVTVSALAFPGNRTHDLGVVSAMLYQLSYRKAERFFIICHIHNHTSIISSEMQVELKKNTAFT